MVFFSVTAKAQRVDNSQRKYRVTAYKAGDNSFASLSNTAKIAPPMTLYIPNAFSSNNDGLNDKFGVTGQGIAYFDMKIFNTWGELVYESKDAKDQWDGNFKGVKAPLTIYQYQISARSSDGDEVYKSGNITLIQ